MIEEKVAMNLVKRALDNFSKSTTEFPALSISKRYYKRYNLNVLNNELNRLNFKCVDQAEAPNPYNLAKDAKNYLLVFQPISKE